MDVSGSYLAARGTYDWDDNSTFISPVISDCYVPWASQVLVHTQRLLQGKVSEHNNRWPGCRCIRGAAAVAVPIPVNLNPKLYTRGSILPWSLSITIERKCTSLNWAKNFKDST